MAPRKRKAPEPKRSPQLAVLLSTTALGLGHLAGGLGRLMARHPRPIFGTLGFAAVFSAIAANALWYQPHRVNAAFLVTRDMANFNALPGIRPKAAPPADMTTFKIERAEPGSAADNDNAEALPALPAEAGDTAAALPAVQPHQPENVALAVAVQQALIQRGLYDGVPDGVIGPRTAAAILNFQRVAGLPQTGEVSEELLKTLAADGSLARQASAAPVKSAPVTTPVVEEDPVAAAIRTANIPAPAAKPAHKDAGTSAPVIKASSSGDELADLIRSGGGDSAASSGGTAQADPALVARIQQGLARMQYRDVTPDGVLGAQTRAAILKFEKDYGLPQTGEPSERVLKKLREIGMV